MNLNELPMFSRVLVKRNSHYYPTYEAILVEHLKSGRFRFYVRGQNLGDHNNHIIPTFDVNGKRIGKDDEQIIEVLDGE